MNMYVTTHVFVPRRKANKQLRMAEKEITKRIKLKIINVLEEQITPTNREITTSSKDMYFYQGDLTLSDFHKLADELVTTMNFADAGSQYNVLRNLLIHGVFNSEALGQCHKNKPAALNSNQVMKIATECQAQRLLQDLGQMTMRAIPENSIQ